MSPRKWLGTFGALVAAIASFVSVGAPRLVLLNDGLRIEYPWARGLAALVALTGLLLVMVALSKRVFRLICGVLAFGVGLVAFHLLRYRLDATEGGLVSRGVMGVTTIAWRDVGSVARGPDLLLISGPDKTVIRIDATDFSPDQEATLERTIARHVRDAGGAAPGRSR